MKHAKKATTMAPADGELCDAQCQSIQALMDAGPVDDGVIPEPAVVIAFSLEQCIMGQAPLIDYDNGQKDYCDKLDTCSWCVALNTPLPIPTEPYTPGVWPMYQMVKLFQHECMCWEGKRPKVPGCPYP